MLMFALLALVAVASAAPQGFPQQASSQQYRDTRILSQRFEQDDVGNYDYGYKLDNGQQVEETGRIEGQALVKQGRTEYVGDDGQTYILTYVSDVNGHQPQASYLPQHVQQIPEYAKYEEQYPGLFNIYWVRDGQFSNRGQNFDNGQYNPNQQQQQQFDNQQFQQF